jgi:hypothetical protein
VLCTGPEVVYQTVADSSQTRLITCAFASNVLQQQILGSEQQPPASAASEISCCRTSRTRELRLVLGVGGVQRRRKGVLQEDWLEGGVGTVMGSAGGQQLQEAAGAAKRYVLLSHF